MQRICFIKPHFMSNGSLVVAAIASACFLVGAMDQVSAEITAPLHRLGRACGFGWGDGYHACRCSGIRPGADLPPRSYCQNCNRHVVDGRCGCGVIGPVSETGVAYRGRCATRTITSPYSSCDGPSCDDASYAQFDTGPKFSDQTQIPIEHENSEMHAPNPMAHSTGVETEGQKMPSSVESAEDESGGIEKPEAIVPQDELKESSGESIIEDADADVNEAVGVEAPKQTQKLPMQFPSLGQLDVRIERPVRLGTKSWGDVNANNATKGDLMDSMQYAERPHRLPPVR